MLPRRTLRRWAPGVCLLIVGLLTLSAAAPIRPDLLSGLVWRSIGPFRGGRIAAVSGAIGQPGVFYAGLPLGGVWKTTSAGVTWFPIFDSIKEVSSIGSIEVAPSDPNVIYVGTGDLVTGGGINEGNGVYKSTDAGKTWQHLGLDATKQIPTILVDPHDPNLVMLGAQGDIHTPSQSRGLYRSTDGGKTWTKTLYVDSITGVQKLAWAYDNPRVMLAATVRHYTDPRVVGRGGGGGNAGQPGTALFKSTDEGLTWKEISGNGLPPLTGRTCVAVAIGTNSQRMYIIGGFGLYRSDDGGASWRQMAANDRRIANGQGNYTSGVYVDPKNPDIVYTLATSSYRSLDGGATFAAFKGAPGGDDPQQMWIDPTDGKRLFLGVDQGATISLDGGQTWSSWYNQATAQAYHISVDNSYPYWVYGTLQDAGSIATRSRGDLGEITNLDWLPTPGYEFGYIVADPLNPRIIYAGGPGGGVVKITYPSGQWINISPNMDTSLALRKVGNQPIVWSATNPHELMLAFQYLMATTDGGAHWKKLSPDLTYPKGETPPAHAPPPGPGAAAAGSIESVSPSPLAGGTIWVGTNNGLIKLTRDHGATWQDVTIAGLPNPTRADISTIEASHHDPATAYAAIDYHTSGDYTPYFYRTHDYGKTWTKIISGMRTDQPSGSFARVIRSDTKKQGLLFAGTESSVYVSFDDGDTWQSLMLNLPNTSYRDFVIKDNDLVAGTYGRSFWILDDFSPLRQMTPAIASEPAHLFKPGDAIRVRRNMNGDTPFPPEVPHAANPPVGALIYYYLGARPSGDISLEISDASGKVVRHMSSAAIAPLNEPPPAVPEYWLAKRLPMPTEPGTNRVNWDIRYDAPPTFTHNYEINANPGETPASPEGPLALPGIYTVRLTVDGKSYSQTLTVKNDPRSPSSDVDLRAQHALMMKLLDGAHSAWAGYTQVSAERAAVAELTRGNPPAEVASAAAALGAKLAAVGGSGGGGRGGGGGGRGAQQGPPPPPNFAAIVGAMNREQNTLDFGDMAPNEPMQNIYRATCAELGSATSAWRSLVARDIPAFNALLQKNNLKTIPVPAAPAGPAC